MSGKVIHGTLLAFEYMRVRLNWYIVGIIGTQFWTATNIADGLNALAVCIEVWPFNFNYITYI